MNNDNKHASTKLYDIIAAKVRYNNDVCSEQCEFIQYYGKCMLFANQHSPERCKECKETF